MTPRTQEEKVDSFTIEVEKVKASSACFGSGRLGVWHEITSPLTPGRDLVTLDVSKIFLEVSR